MRLATVPGFEGHIAEMEEEEAETADSIDPVTLMWNSLRRGYPLMTVYNALRPAKPLNVDPSKVKEKDLPKAATFKFLQACMSELKFPAGECFLITDLYGEDTTGFVKVGLSEVDSGETIRFPNLSQALRCNPELLDPGTDSLVGYQSCKQGPGHLER